MSNRFLLALCGALGVMIGIVALSPLTAEDQPANATSSASYKLAYKFQVGDVVRYETVQKSRFVSQFKGNAETSTSDTQTRKSYRVVKLNEDGSADLELVIEWVKMIVDFGDGSVPTEFDSKDPGAKTQKKFADVLRNIGKPQARMVTATTGKVKKVYEVRPIGPAPDGAPGIKLKDVSGDEYDFLTVFPEKPVKVGEPWTEKIELKLAVDENPNKKQTVELQRTYTLKEVDGDMATIAFRTIVKSVVKDKNIAIQLMQRQPSGKLVFDMRNGAVITRTVDIDESVINPAGNNTAMTSKSHLLERLMTETAAISDIDTDSTKK